MAKTKTSWKPGVSGNPAGRPATGPRAALRDALREAIPGKGGKTWLKRWSEKLIAEATEADDPRFMLEVLKYIDPPRTDQDLWRDADETEAPPRLEIPADDALSPGEKLLLRGVKAGRIKPHEVGELLADAEKAAKLGDAK